MQRKDVARPNYEKYDGLERHEPSGWLRLLSKFTGCDLAIVAIMAITIAAISRGETSTPLLFCSITYVLALGILTMAWGRRKTDAASSTKPAEGKTKPRHARRDQAAT